MSYNYVYLYKKNLDETFNVLKKIKNVEKIINLLIIFLRGIMMNLTTLQMKLLTLIKQAKLAPLQAWYLLYEMKNENQQIEMLNLIQEYKKKHNQLPNQDMFLTYLMMILEKHPNPPEEK